jgi:hypothetical protein
MQRVDRGLAISALAMGTLIVCLAITTGRAWPVALGVAVAAVALVIVVIVTRRMQ